MSLVQLLLDPYYRTIRGFQTLIQKEWLAFGHKFTQRHGTTPNSPQNERAVVFLQFLDAVHQMLKQQPSQFEFNSRFLELIAYHSFSLRFGNFLHSFEGERAKFAKERTMLSLWGEIDANHKLSPEYYNFTYSPSDMPLGPRISESKVVIWHEYFLRGAERGANFYEIPQFHAVHSQNEKITEILMLLVESRHSLITGGNDTIPLWQRIYMQFDKFQRTVELEHRLQSTEPNRASVIRRSKLVTRDKSNYLNFHALVPSRVVSGVCDQCKSSISHTTELRCQECGIYCHENCQILLKSECNPLEELEESGW